MHTQADSSLMSDPDSESTLDDPQRSLQQLNVLALAFIRRWPVPSLIGAVAIGFVVGKIASRS